MFFFISIAKRIHQGIIQKLIVYSTEPAPNLIKTPAESNPLFVAPFHLQVSQQFFFYPVALFEWSSCVTLHHGNQIQFRWLKVGNGSFGIKGVCVKLTSWTKGFTCTTRETKELIMFATCKQKIWKYPQYFSQGCVSYFVCQIQLKLSYGVHCVRCCYRMMA